MPLDPYKPKYFDLDEESGVTKSKPKKDEPESPGLLKRLGTFVGDAYRGYTEDDNTKQREQDIMDNDLKRFRRNPKRTITNTELQ